MSPEHLDIYRRCTGRSHYSGVPFSEATVIAGARAGKDSRIACPILCYEAIFGDHWKELSKGERGMITLVASDLKQTKVAFSYISDYLMKSDLLAGEVDEFMSSEIRLKNGLIIGCFPCTMRATRGWTIPVGVLDEMAFFRIEGNADSDVEVEMAMRRGMLNISRSMLIKISTPYMKSGIVHKDFKDAWGIDNPDILVWKTTSKLMNPTLSDKKLDKEKRRDYGRYLREYEAEFAEDLETFLPPVWIEEATANGIHERARDDRFSYSAGCDPSGGGQDDFTLAICHAEGERIVQDFMKGWGRIGDRAPDLGGVVNEVAGILKRYKLRSVLGDRYAGQWIRQRFSEAGINYSESEDDKSKLYLEMEPLFAQGKMLILDHEKMIMQFRGLEKKPRQGGKTLVDHPAKRHDDYPNALALAVAHGSHTVRASQFSTFGMVESATA